VQEEGETMVEEATTQNAPTIGRQILEIVIMLALVVVAFFGLRAFVVLTYEIPSASMEDTIQVGDRVFSEKISYYGHGPQVGDIVTFADPLDPETTFIKRVIAVGGDVVELRDGSVYVNGEKRDEPFTQGKPSLELDPAPGVEISYPYTVPQDYLWVMGDNRTNSGDSRYFGAIPASSVSGHACFRYWPLDHIGPLE
jgi:signal peptidase I